jgi:acyl homoserine lactone synthase
MIKIMTNRDRATEASLFDQMHQLRKKVFSDRLQWDVPLRSDWEIDRFDDECDPVYLMSLDDKGVLRGSLRVLPTTGPNMLADVFSDLLPDGKPVESATVWESTRFSVDHEAAAERTSHLLNRVTGELLCGIVEVGQLAGLSDVVSVYDAMFARILRRANCPADPIGEPKRIGRVLAFAGLFEISDRMLMNLRSAAGITSSVLEPNATLRLANAA